MNGLLDKELVKLAEKSAREREKREREAQEQVLQAAPTTPTTTSTTVLFNNQIQVQPTIEIIFFLIKNQENLETLIFTPRLDQQSSITSNSTNKYPISNELPAKLQQMTGPNGSIRISTKAKW
ncbi:unnamed protein product [Rotaria sp. Silwood1]|nr:unnamed protein product [Rotaria sp. Silwood1]CAF4762897.1 unnamed protein product [Rotaria sp. Silwood1]